jgi:hypothetical protein
MLEHLPSVPAESIVLEFQQQRAGEYLSKNLSHLGILQELVTGIKTTLGHNK